MKIHVFAQAMFLICFGVTSFAVAQNNPELPKHAVSITAGRTKAGTGDVRGLQIGVEYEKFFKKRWSWSADLVTTIHNQEDHTTFVDESGETQDMILRYTTAGIQLGGKANYYVVRTSKWAAGVKLGTLLRYQSTSLPNSVATYFSPVTGFPFPLTYVENTSPQTTFSVGGTLNLFANYTINNKILLGINTGLQADTNGDTFFPQLLFTIGLRL